MIPQLIQQATQYHQAGQLASAEALYHQVLQLAPTNPDALHLLGVIAFQRNNYDQAEQLIRQAIQLAPTVPYFYNNLGNVLKSTGRLSEAMTCFQQALMFLPNYPDAYQNLGNVYLEQSQWQQAEHCFHQALRLNPNLIQVYNSLGYLLKTQRRWPEALACFQRALTLNPQGADTYNHLGEIYREQGQLVEALNYFQQALTYDSTHILAYNNIGNLWLDRGNIEEAKAYFMQALAINPNVAELQGNFGNVLLRQHASTAAIACYQETLRLKPTDAVAHNNLGMALYEQGKIEEAIAQFRTALAKDPNYVRAHSNLLLMMLYRNDYDNEAIALAHQQFNQQYILPLTHAERGLESKTCLGLHAPRLKIGYLSADFHHHSVAYFIEPVLAHHDTQQFEIYCYYNNLRHDMVTLRLQQYGPHWRDCFNWTDEELAAVIRRDQIDILIDLTGHMEYNRLPVLARKPAPIQVSYLGYSNSTGVSTIDYRIADAYTEPLATAMGTPQISMEKIIRMSPSYFCYQPHPDSLEIPANSLPALLNGYITFGSFNNYAKLSPFIIELWAKLLHRLPTAKLLIKTRSLEDEDTSQHLQAQFAQYRIAAARLILMKFAPTTSDHLRSYHLIDIALDSYPYNGATTTCEALWMGVPVVTWVGNRHVSRMGLSILSTVGLTQLIANTAEEYLEIGTHLANHLTELQQLRKGMRERMQGSPLLDAKRFTRQLEENYRLIQI